MLEQHDILFVGSRCRTINRFANVGA
jgi:hypothetical protein